MIKGFKRFFILLAVLAVAFVIGGLLIPSNYRVERSQVMYAKSKRIYDTINNLRTWPEWTAWTVGKDPTLQVTFEGPEEGVGAIYKWEGEKFKAGMLTITQSDRRTGISYDLNMENGKYLSTGGIKLDEAGDSVVVTWYNEGDMGNNPIHRYFGLLMDRMVGPDFEEGLRNLNQRVKAQ